MSRTAQRPRGLPLSGCRIGITAARKADEQIALFERRGATVVWGPALSPHPSYLDDEPLRAVTSHVIATPPDFFVTTTGVGMNAWFEAADRWGVGAEFAAALGGARILARGPKSRAALRRRGLREEWSPPQESVAAVLNHLRELGISGSRLVWQEHGSTLGEVSRWLAELGADGLVAPVYRIEPAKDPTALHHLIGEVAERAVEALTFTSAPAVSAFMRAAGETSREQDVRRALTDAVVTVCVGAIAADAFAAWDIPVVVPERARLVPMVEATVAALRPASGRTSIT